MPELGEVELLVSRLNQRLQEKNAQPTLIAGRAVHARTEAMWQQCQQHLLNARIQRWRRKAKYLLFEWADNRGMLLAHLRLAGWWMWADQPQTLTVAQGYTLDRHPKLYLTFSWPAGGEEDLVYYDSRMLGEIEFHAVTDWRAIAALDSQAPDFIGTENSVSGGFYENEQDFTKFINSHTNLRSTRTIRDVLMDQTTKGLGAGLGNYLIAEVLYHAGINPNRSLRDLDKQQLVNIYHLTADLFRHVIANEADAEANMVVYQHKQCPKGHDIVREAKGNRGSYYCPVCQPA